MNAHLRRMLCILSLLSIVLAACESKPEEVTPAATPWAIAPAGLNAWTFYDARDPSRPELIEREGGGYRLDPNWQVASIEYVYKWWGLGEPVFDYQAIERDGDVFRKGNASVDTASVRALVGAIENLHASQMLLSGQSHTDDYPSWMIEITGVDGERILLYSASTGNPGSGPWNVLHNGRLYAQYDGSFGDALAKVFSSRSGQPMAAYSPGGREPGTIVFGTQGRPAQLVYGFNGLLPIADGFGYHADVVSGTIEGYVEGRSSIGGYGNMVIGTIDGLHRVELTRPDNSPAACDITPVETDDVASAVWTFSCAIGGAAPGERYGYPIRVEIETDAGERLSVEGELWGSWRTEEDVPSMPPPEELQAAMAQHAAARDLLTDHAFVYAAYQAQIAPATPLSGTLAGEVILIGQTTIDGRPVRYSVGTPFAIQNGQLARWDLSREALNGMLTEISLLALTRRVQAAAPDFILNLWYAEAGETVEVPGLWGTYGRGYGFELRACRQAPALDLPTADEPLRAFGFNAGWSFWMPDFILIGGKPIVGNLNLYPNQDDRGGLLSVLTPKPFDADDGARFDRIWLDHNALGDHPSLTLWVPEQATELDLAAYAVMADALPAPVDKSYNTLWRAEEVTIVVADDGHLAVVACARDQ